jgi:hypothetical protein
MIVELPLESSACPGIVDSHRALLAAEYPSDFLEAPLLPFMKEEDDSLMGRQAR